MKLCVLIPAFNEAKVIRRSILSAYHAGVKSEDVYVVDDGSEDKTPEVVQHYKAQIFSKPNGGKAAALRSGIDHFDLSSRYTHVMVLDADSIVDSDYVNAMERATIRHPNAVLFCGRQSSQRGPWNWLTAYRTVDYAVWCGIYREAQHAMGTINVAPGFASMYKMEIFVSLDFDGGTVVEDMDMTMQLQRRGEEIVYVPDALVATQDPLKLKDFIGQMMRWYRGTWQVIKKHRLGRMHQRIDAEVILLVAEQLIVGAFIMTLPIWAYFFPRFVLFCILADQTIVLTYTTLTAIRERRIELLIMYPTFIIPRLLGYFLFAWAYLLERRTAETRWFSVTRY